MISKRGIWILLIILAGLWAISTPVEVNSTGSLSVPNIIGNLSGTQPASVLDANWTAIVNYVNAREITVGLFSARPSASVSGRYYFATDVAGGTFYVDTGSTWVQVGGPVNASGSTSNVRGLFAGNSSLTVVNASATIVNLRNPSDGSVVARTATSTLSNDSLSTGANGRDQTAQFTANSWAHLYYIWNGSTLATLSSACAPNSVNGSCSSNFGPVLPSGYTHWAYIGAWRVSTANAYIVGDMRGAAYFYRASQTGVNGGTQTTETAVDIAASVPPNAQRVRANARIVVAGGGAVGDYAAIRVISGQNYYAMALSSNVAASSNDATVEFPNVNQNFYYLAVGGTPSPFTVSIAGFTISNGSD